MSQIASLLEAAQTPVRCLGSAQVDMLILPAGDHVDILGRSSLNDLILRVAGGKGDLIEDTIYSKILEYADKVKIQDD